MARLIYAFLALALGSLVAGFLIRDSSVPLFVSIGLSALVLLMILFGTSRRLRRDAALDPESDLSGLEIVEIDEGAEGSEHDEPTVVVPTAPSRKGRSRRTTRARPEEAVQDEPTIVVTEEPPVRSRGRPRRSSEVAATTATIQMPDAAAAKPRRPRAPSPRAAEGAEERERTAVTRPSAVTPKRLPPKVWVIPGRSRYHTRDCRFAKGDQLREVTEATARRRGYVACSVCQPGTD